MKRALLFLFACTLCAPSMAHAIKVQFKVNNNTDKWVNAGIYKPSKSIDKPKTFTTVSNGKTKKLHVDVAARGLKGQSEQVILYVEPFNGKDTPVGTIFGEVEVSKDMLGSPKCKWKTLTVRNNDDSPYEMLINKGRPADNGCRRIKVKVRKK
ncbi:MAG: hypothetical protein ACE366_23400 [Bradymonadia bacterium]